MVLEQSAITKVVALRHGTTGPLSRFVSDIRVVVHDGSESVFVGLPQGQARLILRLMQAGAHAGKSVLVSNGLHVLGARTSTVYKSVTNNPMSLVVRFRPGCARPFFGASMRELADRLVPVQALWGGQGLRLQEDVIAAPDSMQWVALLEESLCTRLRQFDGSLQESSRLARALGALTRTERVSTVRGMADELGVSERQLRRVFDDAVGMPPKQFIGILRFHRALRAASDETKQPWSSVASAAGYYDQAHFIGECRRLTGMAPSAFLRVWRLTNKYREPLL